MYGPTLAILPVSILRISIREKEPTPLLATKPAAVCAMITSSSPASVVPPGLNARNTTSSALSVGGFKITLTPFDRGHSVIPTSARALVLTTDPAFGVAEKRGF